MSDPSSFRALRRVAAPAVLATLALALAVPATAQNGEVLDAQKISATDGGLSVPPLSNDRFGWSTANIGDLDNDGVTDLAVGAFRQDSSDFDDGGVWILFMNADGTVKDHARIGTGLGGFGPVLDASDWFGWAVAGLGDLDNDGNEDIAVSAIQDDDDDLDSGAVYIVYLNANGSVKGTAKINGLAIGGFPGFLSFTSWFGSSIANLGDLDGDGVTDIAVGSHGDSENGDFQGAVWILFLNTNGTVKDHQKINGSQGGFTGLLEDGDEFGWSAAAIGDLDGDGITELAVGADLDDDGGFDYGAVYILFLNADGTVASHQKISADEGNLVDIEFDDRDRFGRSVAALGDFDGDGVEDLAVGAYSDDDGAENAGAVYVLFLDTDGTVKDRTKISLLSGNFPGGLDENDEFGCSVAFLGDLDGDGVGDIAVGANKDDDGSADSGALWVLTLQAGAFEDIGFAFPGTYGDPKLTAASILVAGAPFSLQLSNALESTSAYMVVGFSQINLPFYGGTLVPAFELPNGVFFFVPTSITGDFGIVTPWPPGAPSGLELYLQAWIVDGAALHGLSATNAVFGTVP